ncbi:MAG: winged helix-turn-helix domain-containing protein, partial [Pseudomonadota bacterium]
YYTLPMLFGEHMLGRIDPKLHRKTGVLEVQGIWWEKPIYGRRKIYRNALSEALEKFAERVGATEIQMPK